MPKAVRALNVTRHRGFWVPSQRWTGCDRAGAQAHVGAIRQGFGTLVAGPLTIQSLTAFGVKVGELVGVGGLPGTLRHVAQSLARSVSSALRDLALDDEGRRELVDRLAVVEAQAREEFRSTDFDFVYDHERRLLSVGYNVDEAKLDESSYDLMASEARLGSYVAIAKNDLPTRHWTRLGRSVTAVGGGAALDRKRRPPGVSAHGQVVHERGALHAGQRAHSLGEGVEKRGPARAVRLG